MNFRRVVIESLDQMIKDVDLIRREQSFHLPQEFYEKLALAQKIVFAFRRLYRNAITVKNYKTFTTYNVDFLNGLFETGKKVVDEKDYNKAAEMVMNFAFENFEDLKFELSRMMSKFTYSFGSISLA